MIWSGRSLYIEEKACALRKLYWIRNRIIGFPGFLLLYFLFCIRSLHKLFFPSSSLFSILLSSLTWSVHNSCPAHTSLLPMTQPIRWSSRRVQVPLWIVTVGPLYLVILIAAFSAYFCSVLSSSFFSNSLQFLRYFRHISNWTIYQIDKTQAKRV